MNKRLSEKSNRSPEEIVSEFKWGVKKERAKAKLSTRRRVGSAKNQQVFWKSRTSQT